MKIVLSTGWGLRAVVLTLVAFILLMPIGAGLWQTGTAAFGLLPAIGATEVNLHAWHLFVDLPGVGTAISLSFVTGVTSTVLSLFLAIGCCAALYGRLNVTKVGQALTPFLAAPHTAVAIGLAFVLSPSGWIARLIAPFLDWSQPPRFASVNDPWGIALTLGLMVKEIPFFMLVIFAALTQLPIRSQLAAGSALGYSPGVIWLKIIFPQVWPLIRIPALVVLAYAMSVVDIALILGPSNPPTLAVMLQRLFFDPNVQTLLPASAGAILQLAMAGAAFACLFLVERLFAFLGRIWVRSGSRSSLSEQLLETSAIATLGLMILGALALLSLLVWSLAWRWSWPDLLPESWSLRVWIEPSSNWMQALWQTTAVAICSTALSLALTIAWLEGEDRARTQRASWAEGIVYLPLMVPQISFLFGMNVFILQLGLEPGFWTVVWAHSLFVFPYTMLALSDCWRALDTRLDRTAAALGASPWGRLYRVKLPVLLSPLCTAAAIGVAVSVAQYLPTLFLGAGRVSTLTTEAVTLSSSSDRRVVGAYSTLQAIVPLLIYGLAFLIPSILHRNRRDLRGG